jgi:PAS domain S-box-containing protein
MGYSVIDVTAHGEDAVRRADELRPDLILMDVHLAGGLDGIQTTQLIRRNFDVPVVYLTAHSDVETLRRAAATAVSGYLVKPFRSPDLQCAIEIALYKHAADAQLRQSEQWLATTLQSMTEGVIATDTADKIRLFNPVAEALTGWRKEEAMERPLAEVVALIDEQSRLPLENPVRKAIDARTPTVATEGLTLVSRSGRAVPVDEHAAPIIDSFDRLLGGVLILRDITERRRQTDQIKKLNEQLDQRVQERTAALEVSNRELETFSYSVAHDLRAPLRSISSFGQLLAERHAATLDQVGASYLSRVRAAAERMSQLIDALLALARVGKSEFRSEPVDLSALVRNVIVSVAEAYPGHEVNCVLTDNMRCCGDLPMLRLAISNLLDNAWKFSCRTPGPRVEIGVEIQEGQPVFFVRDNGAGFDPQYAEKLFNPFQRLHSEREFGGTGIGLAIVERVIHRHGGRIWAKSAPGLGATFFFTLRNSNQL